MRQHQTVDDNLGVKRMKGIEALITYNTVDEASKQIGIGRATMYNWLKDPAFDRELKKAKRQLVNRAILRLQQSCRDAVAALAQICRDKKAPPSARVSAAREILNGAIKAVEMEDIEERLKVLEERYAR